MIRLRLTHGLSHSNGFVKATWRDPIVTVEDEAAARFCVDSGFFEIVGDDSGASQQGGKGAQEPPADNPGGNTSDAGNAAQEPPADNPGGNTSDAGNAAQEPAAPGQGVDEGNDTDDGDELDAMTVNQLKVYAESAGIDLGKATKKADIIEAIRKAEAE